MDGFSMLGVCKELAERSRGHSLRPLANCPGAALFFDGVNYSFKLLILFWLFERVTEFTRCFPNPGLELTGKRERH